MTRQLRRHRDFQVTLDLTNDDFIRPPRDAQRQWLLNRALGELVDDLEHLNELAAQFVAGSAQLTDDDRTHRELGDHEIMEDWQIPIMEAMASIVGDTHGDVLEVGFGLGVSADLIQKAGVRSHTVVECNDSVARRFHKWKERYSDRDIRLIHGKWQDTTDQLEVYDAVLFHTYALNQDEYLEQVAQSVTFAEHFFPTAAAHIKDGGVFTYLTNEIDSLSRAHQRLVFRDFQRMTLEVVGPLDLPADSRDDIWGPSMVVIGAVK